jgi:CheY-like chemotaxis protein
MTTWRPTHHLHIRPAGDEGALLIELMAMRVLAGGTGKIVGYTEEEWNAQLEASWHRGADGHWCWRGTRTPLGLMGTITCVDIGPDEGHATRRRVQRTVLVVDDGVRVGAALARSLKPYLLRWKTRCVVGTQRALAALGEGGIDAVICDRRVSQANSIDLLREVAQLHPFVARLLLAGAARLRVSAPAHRVLRKPAMPSVVVAALDAVVAELAQVRRGDSGRDRKPKGG